MLKKENILITGGAGFIGSHLAKFLSSSKYNVTILDNLSTGKLENVPTGCNFILGDIRDNALLSTLLDKIDLCYHLAAIPSVTKSISNWLECHEVNFTGTINIFIQAAKKNIPVIYASSAAVYGDNLNVPLHEDTDKKIISPYGADKLSCELQAMAFGKILGLKTIGLRLFNVYGAKQDPTSIYSGVISIFHSKIKNDNDVIIYGDGHQQRDFIYIKDVISALYKAKDAASEVAPVINVCSGEGISISSLAFLLFSIFNKERKITYKEQRQGDIYTSIGDPKKAELLLGFKAITTLEKGLRDI